MGQARSKEYAHWTAAELVPCWLEAWDEEDRRIREGLPSRYAPPSMLNTR